jgi:nucleoid-associated protein YgaU
MAADWRTSVSGRWLLLLGTVGAAAVVAAAAYWVLMPPPPASTAIATAVVPSAPTSAGARPESPSTPHLDVATVTAPATPDGAAPGGAGAASARTDRPSSSRSLPAFDVVRVEPSGEAVIAGRAMPGSQVEVLDNGAVLERVHADEAGNFVVVPRALPAGGHELTLRSGNGASTPGEQSKQSVVVSVPEHGKGEVLVMIGEPGRPSTILQGLQAGARDEAAAKPGAGVAAPQSSPARAPAASLLADAKDGMARPASPNAAERLASAGTGPVAGASDGQAGAGAPTAAPLHIAAVEAEAGRLYVQGTGPAGGRALIYLNDTMVAQAVISADGRWSLTVNRGLSGGHYAVRVDNVDPAGHVLARAEVPFTYEPRLASATPAAPAPAPKPVAAHGMSAPAVPSTPAVPMDGAAPTVPSRTAPTPLEPHADAPAARPDAPASVPARAEASATVPPAEQPAPIAAAAPAASAPPAGKIAASAPSASDVVVEQLATVAVRGGDTLWQISRTTYGYGRRYTAIYRANDRQIRDPHWIYPGQVFVLPAQAD